MSHTEETSIAAEWNQYLSWTILSESGLGTSSHFPDFLIVSRIEIYRKSREMVIRDLGRRSSWENHESLMILDCLEIFELLMDGGIEVTSTSQIAELQESERPFSDSFDH
jgi:hypothetical protein